MYSVFVMVYAFSHMRKLLVYFCLPCHAHASSFCGPVWSHASEDFIITCLYLFVFVFVHFLPASFNNDGSSRIQARVFFSKNVQTSKVINN